MIRIFNIIWFEFMRTFKVEPPRLSPNMLKRHNRSIKKQNRRGDRYAGYWGHLYHRWDKIQNYRNHRNKNRIKD